jgi:hypothetical protein
MADEEDQDRELHAGDKEASLPKQKPDPRPRRKPPSGTDFGSGTGVKIGGGFSTDSGPGGFGQIPGRGAPGGV